MEILENALKALEIKYDEKMIRQFEDYMNAVLRWNEHVNLTAITEKDDFIKKHFIDSLTCAEFNEFDRAKKIIDVGTGAGFPGLPLAIAFPGKYFILMDSLNKRINILNEIIKDLGLNNVVAIHGRAEELGKMKQHRESYDLCVSRAVSRLSVLSEYCLPFVKIGGFFASYKSLDVNDEIIEAKKSIEELGGVISRTALTKMEEYNINHQIIFIEKRKATPAKYPRKPGTPLKTPLK